ncbi:hypothetical protein NDN08_003108 [Rhodosorus marinus]|uniref:JmjC domain-containing protein n=1 Tax=Rhodosorus marinus TaxID=101924 RepID=A0AAV8UVK3_9RHOD|nr:hypothetical protein NDN08_003108 [Rhodosorus marinus]
MVGFVFLGNLIGLQPSLALAIERGVVERKGTYQKIDKRTLEVEPVVDKTPVEWRPVVDDTVRVYQNAESRLGLKLLAVLIRGSVAKGVSSGLSGPSDLDSLAYFETTKPKNSEVLFRNWMCQEGQTLVNAIVLKYGLASKIEICPYFVIDRTQIPNKFTAATQSVVAYGLWDADKSARVPEVKLAIDIRADLNRSLADGPSKESTQWFLKKALRAGMELSFREVLYFSRDLLPCYEACAKLSPEMEPLFLEALQIACGAESDISVTLSVMREMAMWVETQHMDVLARDSASEPKHLSEILVDHKDEPDSNSPADLRSAFCLFFRDLIPSTNEVDESSLLTDQLPLVAIRPIHQVREASLQEDWRKSFATESEAVVYRGGAKSWPAIRKWTLGYLARLLGDQIEVLVSPSNVFVYCRESHPWITSGTFTPTSRRTFLAPDEVLERMRGEATKRPLFFHPGEERLYVQSRIPPALLDKDAERLQNVIGFGAQAERVWMSTAGSVSALHYDDADSFLVQIRGTKRVIFVKPDDLDKLACFPVGHPLGRRSRIDITEGDTFGGNSSARHASFWREADSRCLSVLLHPGDILFFPARWAHYIESVTASVSLTYRVLRGHGR